MNKKSSKDKLEQIINNEIEILVGTQLISKGFHFPNLNCIVVVDIDSSSYGHDLEVQKKFTIISSISWKSRAYRKILNCIFSNL